MNMNTLRYFKTLAELQHFSRAAIELRISQPSLSYAMSELEASLGVKLFEKDGRNIRITKYGEIFYKHVANGLREIDQGEKLMKSYSGNNSGIIDLAFLYILGTNLIPKVISAFLNIDKYKNIKFRLKQNNTSHIIEKIKSGEFDLGLTTYVRNEPSIEFTKLFQNKFILITSFDHPLAKYDNIDIREIADYPFISYNSRFETNQLIQEILSKNEVAANTICEVEEELTIASLVAVNYGIAIVPDLSMLNNYKVKKINIEGGCTERQICLATAKASTKAPCVLAFQEFILNYIHTMPDFSP